MNFGYKQPHLKQSPFLQGGVSFTFDGGYASQLTAAKILEKYGGRATFFPNYISVGNAGVMTANDLISLNDKGHEVGCYASDGSQLPSLTTADADNQLRTAQETIFNLTGIKGRSCAYPYGSANLREYQLSSRYYERGRQNDGRFQFDGNSFIVHAAESVQNVDKQRMIELIRYCAKQGKKLVFTIHEVNDSGDSDAIPPADFEEVVKEAYSLNFPIVPLDILHDKYNMIPDPWFEHPLESRETGVGWVKHHSTSIPAEIVEGAGAWGENALQFTGVDGTAYGRVQYMLPLFHDTSDYYLRVPYEITGMTTGNINIAALYYDRDGAYLSADTQLNFGTDTTWSIGEINMTAPANARAVLVRLQLVGANNGAVGRIGRVILAPSWAGDYGANPA